MELLTATGAGDTRRPGSPRDGIAGKHAVELVA
jgi:hypothetical protein